MSDPRSYTPPSAVKAFTSVPAIVGMAGMLFYWMTIVSPEKAAFQQVRQTIDEQQLDSELVLTKADSMRPTRLAQAGKYADAITSANELVKANPHDVVSTVCAGKVFLKCGATQDAFKMLKRALALAPRNKYLRLFYARSLATNGQIDEAAGQYRAICQLEPKWLEPRMELGQLLLLNGKPGEAAKEFQAAIETNNSTAIAYKLKGIALARAGQGEIGLESYVEGINVEGRSGVPSTIQQILTMWGDIDRAAFNLEQQINQRPDDPLPRLRLAQIYIYGNELSQAKRYLTEARKIAPQNAEVRRTLAVVQHRLGDRKQAQMEFLHAVALEKAREDEDKKQRQKSAG